MLSSACLARHRSCAPPTLNQTAGGFGTEPWIQHVLEYCETINNEIKTDEMNVTVVVESQFTQLRSCPKKGGGGGGGGASTVFEHVPSAFALQCYTSRAMKTRTLGASQFFEFINP